MPSENTAAGAETTETASEPGGEQVGIQHLGELLQQSEPGAEKEEPGKDEGDGGNSSESSQRAKPTKFNDLAGTLNLELNDLYQLEVSTSEDGEPVTIESLKDLHAKRGEIEMSAIEFEERRTSEEAKLLQAQTELREIIAALPSNAVKPEVLERIRAKHAEQSAQEQQRTLDVIPAWKDDKVREAEITAMTQHLTAYGFPVNYLASVVDHKQMKYIRDNWQREQRIRKALAAVKAGKPNPTTRQKPVKSAPKKNAVAGAKRRSHRDKLQAVFSEID